MARTIAFLADLLDDQIAEALDFVALLENNKQDFSGNPSSLTITSLELTYELAFLRIFGFWESFLEQAFIRLLCGYWISSGQEPLLSGQNYSKKIAEANARMLGGLNYVAWYSPSDMVGRCRKFFSGCNFENVIASANQILLDQSTTRHMIAHVQEHATNKFNVMTMRIAGQRYRGSRPGRFLRSQRLGTNHKWLDHFATQLRGLATQVAS